MEKLSSIDGITGFKRFVLIDKIFVSFWRSYVVMLPSG